MNKELLYKIAITKIPLIGSVMARHLISYCGGVEAIFKTSKRALLKIPGIGEKIVNNIIKCDPEQLAITEIEFLEKHRVDALFCLDPNYPSRLKHFSNAPLLLYYKGTANLDHHRIVSIVGTRKPTEHGRIICQEIIEGLHAYDVVVVSGLAYGIDVTAHKKSLQLNIPNIGVLGHGLKRIYPSAHRSIAEKMVRCGGLLTEYSSDMGPEREHFPMRNRIVAGLCDALIVIETAKKGGSIITAEMANQYNKDVFAVPGRLSDSKSKGCNHLIKIHKAALIQSAEDISYIMRWDRPSKQSAIQQTLFKELSVDEKNIIGILSSAENIDIDLLTSRTKMNHGEMASLLLNLEFKGLIKSMPGKKYMLVS